MFSAFGLRYFVKILVHWSWEKLVKILVFLPIKWQFCFKIRWFSNLFYRFSQSQLNLTLSRQFNHNLTQKFPFSLIFRISPLLRENHYSNLYSTVFCGPLEVLRTKNTHSNKPLWPLDIISLPRAGFEAKN